MEYDELKFKPSSTRQFLYQQVLEQSDLCDVKVKVGHWEKLFHWCVLVASPLFDSIYKRNFLEKQTGTVELRVGTPLTVETALLFLYGKKPKITYDNVSDILELADYLIIPNLKAACIKWLKTTNVTDENCMELLEMTSIYEFELPKCLEYLRRNLPEMMHNEKMLNLTKESLMELLSDSTLSYVPVEEWFEFIIKWAEKSPQRETHFLELFEIIDLEGVDVDYIENKIKKEPLVAKLKKDILICSGASRNQQNHRAFITDQANTDEMLKCFDMDRNKWYRLNISLENDQDAEFIFAYKFAKIAAVRGKGSSEIYKVEKDYNGSTVFCHNLADGKILKTTIVNGDDQSNLNDIDQFHISRQSCLAISSKTVKTKNKENPESEQPDTPLSLYQLARFGEMIVQDVINGRVLSSIAGGHMIISTLYTGEFKDEKTYLMPVLTIINHTIEMLCANDSNVIAMLSSDKDSLFLFEENSNQIERLRLQTDYSSDIPHNAKLAPTSDGFVLYNNKEVICISRLQGPALKKKYKIHMISLEKEDKWAIVRYFFCDNQWFRYQRKTWNDEYEFSCAFHEDVQANKLEKEIDWRPLPLSAGLKIDGNAFIISLPKDKLKCHLECPHCEKSNTTRYASSVDSGDEYYDDDSSDSDDNSYNNARYLFDDDDDDDSEVYYDSSD